MVLKKDAGGTTALSAAGCGHDEPDAEEFTESVQSQTEASSADDQAAHDDQDTRVLNMLYKGNIAEVSRREETERKSRVVNSKHGFYKHTRVTSTAQEEQSALPAGVINQHEDSSDGEE